MEFESFQEGFLLHIGIEEGAKAPVDSILAILGEKGEDISSFLEKEPIKNKEEKVEVNKDEVPVKEAKTEVVKEIPKVEVKSTPKQEKTTASNVKNIASPLAKKLAEERNINLALVNGTGDFGRIIKRDIDNYAGSSSAPTVENYTEIEVSQMRKVIAQRLKRK